MKTPKGYNPYSAEAEKAKWERNKLAFKKWDDFIKSCSESDVYDRIEPFFINHAEETLGSNVVSELTRIAAEGKTGEYMLLLRSNLSSLDWFSRNFFYLQWIKMIAVMLFSIDERKLIDPVPVVPAPNSTESYAATMENKDGPLVMISFEFSRLMLSVFQIITRESTRGDIDNKSRETYDQKAATKILDIIKTIHNDIDVPLNHHPENYTDQEIHYADYLNNQFHCFVLLHEYSHILLNHIDPLKNIDYTKPLTKSECTSLFKNASWDEVGLGKNGMEIPLEKSNRLKDLEADKKAASLLAKPNHSKSDIISNTVLMSSIYVYHYLQMISKVILGFSQDSIEPNRERLNVIVSFIYKDESTIPLLRERHILEIALTEALSE